MDPLAFSANSPGMLVEIEAGNHAFVPSPLPGQFQWTNALINAVSKADRAIGRLAGLGGKLPNPQRLVRMFLRREAELSSRIEQTLARVQTMLLYEHIPGVEEEVPAVREVANNFRVLEFSFASLRRMPVSVALIRRMHEILLEGIEGRHLTPGKFRKLQNWIGSTGNIEDARYVPPPPHEVDPRMRELIEYVRRPGDLPPIVRCAMVHYQFEAIHPFVDGNGRVGRALVLLMLHAEDVLPVPLLNPSAQLEARRKEYYDFLIDVSLRGSWAPWIEFFATCVADEAESACARLMAVDALRDQYRERLSAAGTSALLLKLVDELFAEPAITLRQATAQLGVNPATAQRLIEKLVRANVLREVTGKQRNRVYVAQELIDLFTTDAEKR